MNTKLRAIFAPDLSPRGSVGLLVLRLVAGTAFLFHGFGKIQHPFEWMGPGAPVPGFLQGLAAISEFGGGLAWLLGLLTPLASFGIACTMAFALATHLSHGDPFVSHGGPSFELALDYLAVALLLLLAGPGRYALDAKLFRRP